ncbi:MAG TPA: adenylate/guanylate cyclase domain-containing protein [Verrucomicrobiae bacterium]
MSQKIPSYRGHILVVDDDRLNRQLLGDCLGREGYSFEQAENGFIALQHIGTSDFDVILLDIDMPEMNGIEVLHTLKSDLQLRHLPVIVISASSEMDRALQCIEIGADDYLPKPFNPLLLRTRLNAALQRKRWHDQEQSYLQQLEGERAKSDALLLNVLPVSIADRLKNGENTIADSFPEATVLFADIVGFTNLSTVVSPSEIVFLLNEIFSAFDQLAAQLGLEKIKTIGDCYMVVGGLPEPKADHAEAIATMALAMLQTIQKLNTDYKTSLRLRIGINTGPVVAGVIGRSKFIYDLWGDAVNTASRMESHGQPDRIQVSASTCEQVKQKFVTEPRGEIEVKGKGKMQTWWLISHKNPTDR